MSSFLYIWKLSVFSLKIKSNSCLSISLLSVKHNAIQPVFTGEAFEQYQNMHLPCNHQRLIIWSLSALKEKNYPLTPPEGINVANARAGVSQRLIVSEGRPKSWQELLNTTKTLDIPTLDNNI